MTRYICIRRIDDGVKTHEPGELIELADDAAQTLLASGAVSRTEDAPPETDPAPLAKEPIEPEPEPEPEPDPEPEPEPEDAPEAVRALALKVALAELKPEDFTGGGKPEVKALERISGLTDITAKERDALWAAHLEEKTDDQG